MNLKEINNSSPSYWIVIAVALPLTILTILTPLFIGSIFRKLLIIATSERILTIASRTYVTFTIYIHWILIVAYPVLIALKLGFDQDTLGFPSLTMQVLCVLSFLSLYPKIKSCRRHWNRVFWYFMLAVLNFATLTLFASDVYYIIPTLLVIFMWGILVWLKRKPLKRQYDLLKGRLKRFLGPRE